MPTPFYPPEETLREARSVIANPSDHTPQLRRLAFCLLKTAEGVRIIQSQLPGDMHPRGGAA